MKYMNHIKSGLLAMTFVCVGSVFTGCEDDITINAADSSKLETVDGMYGYVKSAAGARELTPISIFGDKAGAGHLYFELSKAAAQDVTVTFKVDAEALEAYNTAHGTSYTMYPADKLSLANGGTTTVKSGDKKSAPVELTINAGGSIGSTYAVAISATANDGVEVSANNQTYIYLVKPMAAVPDSRKGDVLTHCFVEVNDESILNCGEYTMKKSGKPFFDVVSIFAANINVDSETGRVHVFCNDKVSFLLKNADKFIRPLQAKGIKVNMTLLGNHDEAGMGNLSAEAAADFAKELKAYMDIYGLDGVDFDDEYTTYPDNPSPGFLPRSRENFARLIYECRQQLPDKLLGIYEYMYDFIDSPTGTVEGKTVGELVDYMTYGYYQNQSQHMEGKGREKNFEGLPKSKYCPTPLKINDELSGGWDYFHPEYIQDMKDSGYGVQMFYNPKPLKYNYGYFFTAVSSILFDDEVEWSGNYYARTDTAPIKGTSVSGYEALLGDWTVTSSNSLYVYIDEENNPRWWDWSGSQNFDIRIEEKEAGKSYYVYGWGTYPEITSKYPLVLEYNGGNFAIPVPQTIHKADAKDPITWEMCWGTYGKVNVWNFYTGEDYTMPINGTFNVNGNLVMIGIGNRWGIDPCHEVDGKLIPPHMDVKSHITENYTLVKKN
ncbi:DUF1735 domain-containing protein [uncultured Bacteroides sp.]|uniref:BT_3987 domain-containing protein n=1 Tax=uncultured Bacteroides sp. TaxID=162156 RepID=UPI0025D43291|nr:DUF1735 domain-containing protein [uncultured Bacteroides sp.]